MAESYSLEQLSQYLSGNMSRIGELRKEVEEIQVGFNSAYVEWKARHDAQLERVVEAIVDRWNEAGPDLQARIEKNAAEEQDLIEKRRQKLRDEIIPQTQAEADEALQDAQTTIEILREENPRLDEREESLKKLQAMFQEELAQLNEKIRALSGCLGVLINFFKINKLDRQRQRVIGQLYGVRRELRDVRREWRQIQREMQTEQENQQSIWQLRAQAMADLRAELDYLDDDANRQRLALKRATRHVLDNLKEPVAGLVDDLKEEMDAMIEANIQTDTYQEALGSVSGFMALLDGINEGLKRFDTSVAGLIKEQRMHSAHLSRLSVNVPAEVASFHQQWEGLAKMVRDDGHLCAHPPEFVALVKPVIEGNLSQSNVKQMFESLGGALNQATSRWRG
jgi:chromosome segregation ATPase